MHNAMRIACGLINIRDVCKRRSVWQCNHCSIKLHVLCNPGDPINCWVPAHFTGNHEEYTNNYCWIRNTYYLPFENDIPKPHEDDKRHMITYYQWMPLILLVQVGL